MLACERCHAPLLNFAQSLFAFNDARVRFVNARRREFAIIQEFLDNGHCFRRDVRIALELIRNCEHVHARLKGEQHYLLVARVLRDRCAGYAAYPFQYQREGCVAKKYFI